jgi:hypothetical protein
LRSRHARAPRSVSLAAALAELPDGVEVYPGHVAGSLCGAGMSSKASSTIGFERRFNHAMTIANEEDFVEESAGGSQLRRRTWSDIVALNRAVLGAPQGSSA